jgi:hypothetical protein
MAARAARSRRSWLLEVWGGWHEPGLHCKVWLGITPSSKHASQLSYRHATAVLLLCNVTLHVTYAIVHTHFIYRSSCCRLGICSSRMPGVLVKRFQGSCCWDQKWA